MKYKYYDEKKEHLHTLDEQPLMGTSTVCKSIGGDKTGGLIWWSSGKAVEVFGWKNSKYNSKEERIAHAMNFHEVLKTMSIEDYVDILERAYRAHADNLKETASDGTDLHALLEDYVKLCLSNEGTPILLTEKEDERVKKFSLWAFENVKEFIYSEGHCYSEKLWVGGISDAGAVMKDGKISIIDFKSAKKAYEDHFIQCAGYDLLISENGILDKDGNEVLKPFKADAYYVVPFGAKEATPEVRYNTEELREGFLAALIIYKLIK